MALQFILGNSGSGKTKYMFEQVVREAGQNPSKNYLIIVPEQFTLQTQQTLVSLAPNQAIMNIDVLSFKRLAYRVFDDMGMRDLRVLEETGKNLVLRKVAQEKEDSLTVLRPNMSRMGYIGELKSLISEMVQYNITPDQLEKYSRSEKLPPSFAAKIRDIVTMYRGFEEYMQGNYVTAEEILNVLISVADKSELLRDSVLVFDEFTGFTPIQNRLLYKLLPITDRIYVLLTMDEKENPYECSGEHELFYLTKKTVQSLSKMADELQISILKPVLLGDSRNKRFCDAPALSFMEQNLFRAWYQKSNEPVREISITNLKDSREELIFAAREINRLIQQEGYRYRDIAVVTGAVDTYSSYVDEIFGKYNIPYFMDQTTEILFHPFIEFVRAILEVVESGFNYESIMRFLKCGFCDIPEDDIDYLDNYLIATGIHGKNAWSKRWLRMPRNRELVDLVKLDGLRADIYQMFVPLFEAFDQSDAMAGAQIKALYELLISLEVEQKLWQKENAFLQSGNQVKSKEYGQIYRIVMELLEKFYQLLGEEHLGITDFIEILEAGLSAAQVAAIPPGYDNVTIGDIERTRLDYIKILFFVGVNDGIIPKAGNQGGIISEYEREMLQQADMELAPGAREQAFIQRFYLYRNLTKPSKQIYISYSRVDQDGKKVRPSYLIEVIRRMFPKLKLMEIEDIQRKPDYSGAKAAWDYLIHGERDDAWYALAKYFTNVDSGESFSTDFVEEVLKAPYAYYAPEPISRAVAKAIYGRNLQSSVTRLEQFASCAYAHFLRYGLGLVEREESRFASLDIGNIYHTALEKYSSKLEQSEFDWFNIPDEKRDELAEFAMQEAVEEYPSMSIYATAENAHMAERMMEIFKQTTWALTKQVQAGEFTPTGFELSFSQLDEVDSLRLNLGIDEKMQLLGRIDRLDTCVSDGKVYVKIIDYKSGNTKFDLIRIYRGLSLQLVVYMNTAMEYSRHLHPAKEILPGGILYYHIDDPMIEEAKTELTEAQLRENLLLSLRPDGLVNSEEDIYRAMDKDFEKKSLVIPVELKKTGELSERGSHVASTEEFSIIEEYVKREVVRQGQRIFEGQIQINPYKDRQECSCNYCPYSSVCGMDGKIPGYSFRHLESLTKEDAIERMKQECAQ